MKKQEALERLKWLRNKSPLLSNDNDYAEPLDMAISALEKQIAEKIEKDIVIDEDYSGNTYEREIPVCPSCNYIYLTLKQPYCNQCGQKLDWSVEE